MWQADPRRRYSCNRAVTQSKSQVPNVQNDASQGEIVRAAVLVVSAGLICLLSSGARAYSVDDITNYTSAWALVETGGLDLAGEQPSPTEQLLVLSHPR